jgi:aminoglycoside 3-N-acetyltransferase
VIRRQDIADGVGGLGVQRGMGLMVHSSLSSFGHVEGGALAVVEALMEAVGDTGTLLMPSFNHEAPWKPGGAGLFDPSRTPTTNGAIPETFWRVPGVCRSLNPTHAYAAWGRGAEDLVDEHHLTLTMGHDSPLGKLCARGGWGLFLGTDYSTNTLKHVTETTTGAHCLGRRTEALPVRLPGNGIVHLRTWSWRERSCPIMEPCEHVEAEMERLGLHRRGWIGPSRVTLFRLQDCYRVMAEMLARGHAGHPPCSGCPIRSLRGPHTVESDWDPVAGRLSDDSPAKLLTPQCFVAGQAEWEART